jgi:hypothetical protein
MAGAGICRSRADGAMVAGEESLPSLCLAVLLQLELL